MNLEELTKEDWDALLKSVEDAFAGFINPTPSIPSKFYVEVVEKYLLGESHEIIRDSRIVSWLYSAANIPFERIPVLINSVNTFAKGVFNFRLERGC